MIRQELANKFSETVATTCEFRFGEDLRGEGLNLIAGAFVTEVIATITSEIDSAEDWEIWRDDDKTPWGVAYLHSGEWKTGRGTTLAEALVNAANSEATTT